MRKLNAISVTGLSVLMLILVSSTGCKKEVALSIPTEVAHFLNQTGGNYFVTAPNLPFTITVGVTTVSKQDRTVSFSVTSPTGAAQGTQYTLSANSVVIPAGEATATFTVTGIYSAYTSGRKDSLIFTIDEAGVKPSGYNNTYKLYMRGPCFEGEVAGDLDGMLGVYANTNETWFGPWGPYTTTVSSITLKSPTTADIVVENVFDFGWGPITFTLDWTDPANTKVTLVEQSGIADAGTLSGAYAGEDVSVRPHSDGNVGTFTYCNQKIVLYMQIGVTGLGWFSPPYIVTMER